MPNLKLAKLPDRTPVKHMILVMPELDQKLRDYADLYRQSYGEVETVETLIPFILDAFLKSDRSFARAHFSGRSTNGIAASSQAIRTRRQSNLKTAAPSAND